MPTEPLTLSFSGFDNRLPHHREFSPIRIIELSHSPDHWLDSTWTGESWILSVYGALSTDRQQIHSSMVETGFAELIGFLEMPRTALWKGLKFSRAVLWDTKRKRIEIRDQNQLEKKHA
jgi:hypothetical protein